MGSAERNSEPASAESLEEITDLFSPNYPESEVARACRATVAALSEFAVCLGGPNDPDTEPARLRFERAFQIAQHESLASKTDILPKCLLHRHLLNWAGEEDRRVQRLGTDILKQITIFLMGGTDGATSGHPLSLNGSNGSNGVFNGSSASK